MYLSRLILNPLNREIARAVSDVQRMHSMVMSGFASDLGPNARQRLGVLYRLEVAPTSGALTVIVQSAVEPSWRGLVPGALPDLSGGPSVEVRVLEELERVAVDQVLRFRLRANATRRIETKSVNGQRRHGRRVPHRDDARCLDWLKRQSRQHGFEIGEDQAREPEVWVSREPPVRGRRSSTPLTIEGVRFDGLLRVRDPSLFREAVQAGVGPAKAYGFGLLSFRSV